MLAQIGKWAGSIGSARRVLGPCAAFAFGLLPLSGAHAQGFSALVSPPRFELSAQPGKTLRAVVEITNADARTSTFKLKTADWWLDKDYGVQFEDALQKDSCRPWVAIERREIKVAARGKYRYRFQVTPPAGIAPRECRFALLIEGSESAVKAQGVDIPVSGRIGVIVYVAVGAVAPQLQVVGTQTAKVNGQILPVIQVKNSGNAHGRLAGFLSGTDGAGKKLEFTPSAMPILAGETRNIVLTLNQEDERKPVAIQYPITVRGKLEWGDKTTPFEQRFAP